MEGSSREEEFRMLEAVSESCSDFGQRLLIFPSATTFHTYPKNRYKNILPNENTRVRLSPQSNQEGSDYINANFITLQTLDEHENVYISTQAPLESTFDDFWRMVWEQSSPCIITLTKLCEKNRIKADRYWPSKVGSSEKYGDITVLHQTTMDLGFLVRKFMLTKNGEERMILQFHFLDWPDFGVPTSSVALRHMIKLSDIWQNEATDAGLNGPMIVHCSAGVGRSGSFIAMHCCLKNLKETDQFPNVSEIVRIMRLQRLGMVQTLEQYEFIYSVLEDEFSSRKSQNMNNHLMDAECFIEKISTSTSSEDKDMETDFESDTNEAQSCQLEDDDFQISVSSVLPVSSPSAVEVSG